jgi:hypothetical protein
MYALKSSGFVLFLIVSQKLNSMDIESTAGGGVEAAAPAAPFVVADTAMIKSSAL